MEKVEFLSSDPPVGRHGVFTLLHVVRDERLVSFSCILADKPLHCDHATKDSRC